MARHGRMIGAFGAGVALTLAGFFAFTKGCGKQTVPAKPLRMWVKDAPIDVELAITIDQQDRGLTLRKHLDPDRGMLFVELGDTPMVYRMSSESLIPLACAFIRADLTVANIVEMKVEPSTMPDGLRTTYRASEPVRYALQMNKGWFASHGIEAGDKVRFSDEIKQQLPVIHTGNIWVGDHEIEVELALTSESRRRGLMWRESLPTDTGMLFVEDEDRKFGYWMKNCKMPIAIAYVRADLTIANILEMRVEPAGTLDHEHETYPSDGPVRYALEMQAGWFAEKGIKPGDKLRFSSEVAELVKTNR